MKKVFNEESLMAWKTIDSQNWMSFVSEITNVFFDVGKIQIDSLKSAWLEKDYAKVGQIAHSLKSTCGNVGAERAHELLDQIESAIAKKDLANLDSMMEKIDPLFNESASNVFEFVKKNQAA
jgi:HPt (histidine-containing phosphotransfer) domain-containing protein